LASEIDKFAKVKYKEGVTGCPLVTEHALSVLEAKVIHQIDLGSHTIFVADTIRSEPLKEGNPLTYKFYQENLKGKSPSTAPTFNPGK